MISEKQLLNQIEFIGLSGHLRRHVGRSPAKRTETLQQVITSKREHGHMGRATIAINVSVSKISCSVTPQPAGNRETKKTDGTVVKLLRLCYECGAL